MEEQGASEDQGLFEELSDILIFVPNDLAELGKDQLHIVSDDPDSTRLVGQLWGAAKVSNGAKELAEPPRLPAYVLQGWGAHHLANATSADSAKESELGRTFSSQGADRGLSAEECDATGPRGKIRRLADGATSTADLPVLTSGSPAQPVGEL